VFGIKLQPGVAHLLTSAPVAALDGLGEPAAGVLAGVPALTASLLAADGTRARIAVAETFLRDAGIEPTRDLRLVQRAVRALATDPAVRRVRDVARRLGVSERTLQRLCAEHLGVSPGWVLRRGRLHAAAERLIQAAGSGREALADVAVEFGYADQAHLARDFRRVLGAPPSVWMAGLVTDHPVE
jgi:AraC-like DNA-binding protein